MWSRISDAPAASLTGTAPGSRTGTAPGHPGAAPDDDPVRIAWRRALRLGPLAAVTVYAAGTLAGQLTLAPLAVAVGGLVVVTGLVLAAVLTSKNLTSAAYSCA